MTPPRCKKEKGRAGRTRPSMAAASWMRAFPSSAARGFARRRSRSERIGRWRRSTIDAAELAGRLDRFGIVRGRTAEHEGEDEQNRAQRQRPHGSSPVKGGEPCRRAARMSAVSRFMPALRGSQAALRIGDEAMISIAVSAFGCASPRFSVCTLPCAVQANCRNVAARSTDITQRGWRHQRLATRRALQRILHAHGAYGQGR